MATPTITKGTVVLAHQAVAHPNTVTGAAQDVSSIFSARVYCYHGFVEAAANTNPGTFLIQTTPIDTDDEDWATEIEFSGDNGTPDSEQLSGTEAVGQKVLEVASTTGFSAGNLLYIQDVGVVADGEWARCEQIVTNTSIDIIDGLTNAKDSSDIIFNRASIFMAKINLIDANRLRVVFQHEGGTGADVHVKALMVTLDNIG